MVILCVLFVAGFLTGLIWRWRASALLLSAFALGMSVALLQFDDWASAKHDVGNLVEFCMLAATLAVYFAFWYVPAVAGAGLGIILRRFYRKP